MAEMAAVASTFSHRHRRVHGRQSLPPLTRGASEDHWWHSVGRSPPGPSPIPPCRCMCRLRPGTGRNRSQGPVRPARRARPAVGRRRHSSRGEEPFRTPSGSTPSRSDSAMASNISPLACEYRGDGSGAWFFHPRRARSPSVDIPFVGEQEGDGVHHLHPCVVFFTFAGRCASAH